MYQFTGVWQETPYLIEDLWVSTDALEVEGHDADQPLVLGQVSGREVPRHGIAERIMTVELVEPEASGFCASLRPTKERIGAR